MSTTISEEMINAYIDNELDAKDNQFIEIQLKNDAVLQHRIEQLQELKLNIRASYSSVHSTIQQQTRTNSKH